MGTSRSSKLRVAFNAPKSGRARPRAPKLDACRPEHRGRSFDRPPTADRPVPFGSAPSAYEYVDRRPAHRGRLFDQRTKKRSTAPRHDLLRQPVHRGRRRFRSTPISIVCRPAHRGRSFALALFAVRPLTFASHFDAPKSSGRDRPRVPLHARAHGLPTTAVARIPEVGPVVRGEQVTRLAPRVELAATAADIARSTTQMPRSMPWVRRPMHRRRSILRYDLEGEQTEDDETSPDASQAFNIATICDVADGLIRLAVARCIAGVRHCDHAIASKERARPRASPDASQAFDVATSGEKEKRQRSGLCRPMHRRRSMLRPRTTSCQLLPTLVSPDASQAFDVATSKESCAHCPATWVARCIAGVRCCDPIEYRNRHGDELRRPMHRRRSMLRRIRGPRQSRANRGRPMHRRRSMLRRWCQRARAGHRPCVARCIAGVRCCDPRTLVGPNSANNLSPDASQAFDVATRRAKHVENSRRRT